MSLIVDRRNLDFLMYEMLDLRSVLGTGRYHDCDEETVTSILDAAQAIAEEKFLPSAARVDANEPTFDGEKVSIIPEIREALDAYTEAGFFAAGFDADIGGMPLPRLVTLASGGMFSAANLGVTNYPFLTRAAAAMLHAVGDEQQKSVFLPPMLEGRWFGTMCLSETQAGSSLSDIRTKATPSGQGHYLIEGSKMWISGGEHELAENIVHMVLAKIPGGPPGVKGISLFIVPRYRIKDDGSLGEKNGIELAGLNHKMGQRGTINCLLNFGEKSECHGYLMGEPHQGLRYMFHMMNEARIGVGYRATMSGLAGYLYSLDYAQQRSQGRLPLEKDPASPQVKIIEHADVRRMLLAQKSYVEGAMALLFYCSWMVDQQEPSQDDGEKARIALLLDVLTPVAKSWPSEYCLEANKLAIQVLGGYGYARDYPVERHYRDNRLNHIHEGTYGIQALDLLGRKVRMHKGAALQALLSEMEQTMATASGHPALAGYVDALRGAIAECGRATQAALTCADLNLGLANATAYLDGFGHVVIAWLWLRQAIVADKALPGATGPDMDFYQGKLLACRYFYRHELPKTRLMFDLVASLDDTCLSVETRHFAAS